MKRIYVTCITSFYFAIQLEMSISSFEKSTKNRSSLKTIGSNIETMKPLSQTDTLLEQHTHTHRITNNQTFLNGSIVMYDCYQTLHCKFTHFAVGEGEYARKVFNQEALRIVIS